MIISRRKTFKKHKNMTSEGIRRSARGHIPRKDGIVYTIHDFDCASESDDDEFREHEDVSDSETPEERAERLAEEAALENADDSSLESDDGLDTNPAPKKRKTSSDASTKKNPKPTGETFIDALASAVASKYTKNTPKQETERINELFGVKPKKSVAAPTAIKN